MKTQREQWYAVQTKSKSERIAQQNLQNQNFLTFLPMLRATKHRRGACQALVEPLFPGYLFVEMDLQSQNTASIHYTRGVVSLVRQGNVLVPVPINIINCLQQAQSANDDAIDPAQLFEPGDEVTLIGGPMAGLTAVFKARNSQERVIVLLSMLGNETLINVSQNQVARVG